MQAITCKSGHALTWTTDASGYMGGKFACDLCHKSADCSTGHWTCPCKFDVCTSCRPVPSMSSVLQCSKGHWLEWATMGDGYMGGMFSCDLCKTSHACGEGRWSCLGCRYDLCSGCRAAPVAGLQMTAFVQCKNGHPLLWSGDASGYMGGKFSCDLCHKANNASFGRWHCPTCKYDVCILCRSPVAEQCSKGHDLRFSTDCAGYMGGMYSCDKCHKSHKCEDGRYTCECKYDICAACKSS